MLWAVTLFLFFALIYYYKSEIEVSVKYSSKPVKRSVKVGIVTDWHRTGVPYQSKFLSKCLGKKHNVHIFGYSHYIKDNTEWGYSNLVFTRKIKPWKLINWIKKEGLKVVFFPDRLESHEVLDWCKKNNVATVMIINYETIKKSEFDIYRKYTCLMCPVRCTYDLLKKNGFRNLKFIRWAVDDDVFLPQDNAPLKPPVRFIHNAGLGGAQWRKNTLAAVEAFDFACKKNKNIVLILKSQRPIKEYPQKVRDIVDNNGRIRVVDRDMEMPDLIDLYRSCHVSLLPSKWEGIGIPFIESLSVGLPVITVDAPPMNEWVRNRYNGLTARVARWEHRKDRSMLVKGALADVSDLSKKMVLLSDFGLIRKMGANASRSSKGMKKKFTSQVERLIRSL